MITPIASSRHQTTSSEPSGVVFCDWQRKLPKVLKTSYVSSFVEKSHRIVIVMTSWRQYGISWAMWHLHGFVSLIRRQLQRLRTVMASLDHRPDRRPNSIVPFLCGRFTPLILSIVCYQLVSFFTLDVKKETFRCLKQLTSFKVFKNIFNSTIFWLRTYYCQ